METKSRRIKKIAYKISVSDLLEKIDSEKDKEEGFDIADYFIKNKLEPLEESQTLSLFKQKKQSD
jgi:dephospho-CoA kinase